MLPYGQGFPEVDVELELASRLVLGELQDGYELSSASETMTVHTHALYRVCTESFGEDAQPSKNAMAVRGEMDGSSRFPGQL
jgi:hypothetical protein